MAEKNPPAAKKAAPIKGLTVAAIQEGGRHRVGRHWPQSPVFVALSDLKEGDVELLKADKKLMVLETEQAAVEANDSSDSAPN